MSIVAHSHPFVVGVDTHARKHVYAIITPTTSELLETRDFPATKSAPNPDPVPEACSITQRKRSYRPLHLGHGDQSNLVVKPSSGHRVIGIEGLRGLAAFSVVFHHVGAHLGGSGVAKWVSVAAEHGLTLFFVMSGFLLYQPFVRGIRSGRFPDVRRYFRNRVVRILPGYLAVFLLVSFLFGAAYLHGAPQAHMDNPVGYLTDPGTILADLFLVQTHLPQYVMTGIGPAWSLTAEILFYLALPCLAYLSLIAARSMRLRHAVVLPAYLLIGIGLAATAWSFLARRGMDDAESFMFSWGNTWTAVAERSFFAQADLFGYGMIAAAVIARVNEECTNALTFRYKLILAAIVVVLAGLAVSGVLRGGRRLTLWAWRVPWRCCS